CGEIPYSAEQGILFMRSGNSNNGTGNTGRPVGPAKTANPQQVKSGGKHRVSLQLGKSGCFSKNQGTRGGYQNAITPKWRGQQLRLTGGRATTGETPCCVPSGERSGAEPRRKT